MAASPPWAQLPTAVLHEIVRLVPCGLDRLRVDFVCRSWRAALALLPPPPPLPWLLLPYADGPSFSCVHSGCGTHLFQVPHGLRDARYFGSYDGGWLFLAVNHTRGQGTLNIIIYELLDLPDVLRLHPGEERQCDYGMVILAAALSSPPDEEGCIAAGIITSQRFVDGPRHITFWRMGDQAVSDSMRPELALLEVADVIFHNGAFHFLTQGEQMSVCAPISLQDGGLEINLKYRCLQPLVRDYDDQYVQARYLVESRGQLLMVVRLTPRRQLPTSAFRVFRMIQTQMPNNEVEYTWNELPTLDGRMLFVGRGCSRSYEVADYPGFEDSIYFSDDRSFYNAAMIFGDANGRQYSCSDNGKWSGAPPHVERCFPELGPSSYSPPVWFLP